MKHQELRPSTNVHPISPTLDVTTTLVGGRHGASQLLLLDAEHLQLGAHVVEVERLVDVVVVGSINLDLDVDLSSVIISGIVGCTLSVRLRLTLTHLVVNATGDCWVGDFIV